MKLCIATASNQKVREWRDMCEESILRYCERYPETSHKVCDIPKDYRQAPGWFKIGMIAKLLPDFDYVLWIDPDALIIGDSDFTQIIQPRTLNIAKDKNGINVGVMAWRNCPQAFKALQDVEGSYPWFRRNPMNEQAALLLFIDHLRVYYQPKHIWNAYPHPASWNVPDVTDETMVVHWPGTAEKDRAELMREFLRSHEVAA
jgi:hypothetical protein